MNEHEYFSTKALSQSTLKLIRKSPADARLYFEHQSFKDTPSLRKGKAFHALTLENKKVYVTCDSRDKNAKAAIKLQNSDKIFLTSSEVASVENMAIAIRSNPDAMDFISLPGDVERSLFWEEDGLQMKARLDKVIAGIGVIDAKSTDDATPGGFARSIYKWGYHIQAAHYLSGCMHCGIDVPDEFIFLAVESSEPYYSAVYRLDSASLEEGRLERKRLIKLWKECVEKNIWPAYTSGIKKISIPRYAFEHIIPS